MMRLALAAAVMPLCACLMSKPLTLPLRATLSPPAKDRVDIAVIGHSDSDGSALRVAEGLSARLGMAVVPFGDAAAGEAAASGRIICVDSAASLSGAELSSLVSSALSVEVVLEGIRSNEAAAAAHYMLPVRSNDDWEEVLDEAERLVLLGRRPKRGKEDLNLDLGVDTFFASLTFPRLEDALPHLRELEKDVDALEVRADLLWDQSEFALAHSLSVLRRKLGKGSRAALGGVVFTVRSTDQCGAFDLRAEGGVAKMHELLKVGLRCGVETLDVEWGHGDKEYHSLLRYVSKRYPSTATLGSYHAVGHKVPLPRARRVARRCYARGLADAVKVVFSVASADDAHLYNAAVEGAGLPPEVPKICVCLGDAGRSSRALNRRFSPVTHAALPVAAAPGQLSPSALLELRRGLGLLPDRSYWLFGGPSIASSPSPDMHNAAFRSAGLADAAVYARLNEPFDLNAMAAALMDEGFGGASVTIPHKESVIELLDGLTPLAEALGAVNTVFVRREEVWNKHYGIFEIKRTLVGTNTDCSGMLEILAKSLAAQNAGWSPAQKGAAGLVLGAGGTARAAVLALRSLGMDVYLWNRSADKARALAEDLGGVTVLEDLSDKSITEAMEQTPGKGGFDGLRAVVCTVPAKAGLTLPARLLARQPVVLDASYDPPETALLRQARAEGCPTLRGADLLLAQGVQQWELWTGRRAHVDVMKQQIEWKIAALAEKQRQAEQRGDA